MNHPQDERTTVVMNRPVMKRPGNPALTCLGLSALCKFASSLSELNITSGFPKCISAYHKQTNSLAHQKLHKMCVENELQQHPTIGCNAK